MKKVTAEEIEKLQPIQFPFYCPCHPEELIGVIEGYHDMMRCKCKKCTNWILIGKEKV